MIKVYLPDGAALELSDGANCLDAAKAISAGLARAAFAAEVDGKAVELMTPLTDGAHIAILTSGDDALHMMRHTASHVPVSYTHLLILSECNIDKENPTGV